VHQTHRRIRVSPRADRARGLCPRGLEIRLRGGTRRAHPSVLLPLLSPQKGNEHRHSPVRRACETQGESGRRMAEGEQNGGPKSNASSADDRVLSPGRAEWQATTAIAI
jgi:hypothetical protein